jgi:hypothetical protein
MHSRTAAVSKGSACSCDTAGQAHVCDVGRRGGDVGVVTGLANMAASVVGVPSMDGGSRAARAAEKSRRPAADADAASRARRGHENSRSVRFESLIGERATNSFRMEDEATLARNRQGVITRQRKTEREVKLWSRASLISNWDGKMQSETGTIQTEEEFGFFGGR